MKQCRRCSKWFHSTDSEVCDPCWEDLGQMSLWQDEDDSYGEAESLEAYEPPIDTVFDREEEARGYQ